MRFVLVGTGSAGDLVPCLRLAGALSARGHRATVVALEEYSPQHPAVHIHTVPGGEETMWPASPVLRRLALTNPGVLYLTMRRKLAQLAPRLNDALLQLVDADTVLISNSVTLDAGRLLTYARGARHATLLLAPLLPSTSSASSAFVPRRMPRPAGAALARLMWALTRELGGACTEDMRCRVGGPGPTGLAGSAVLMATSPVVSPPSARWPSAVAQTGWFRTEPATGSALDPELEDFLQRHPTPVVMSFGTTLVGDPARDLALFRAATPPSRGLIVQSRALPPGRWGNDAFNAVGVDHVALLPRVSAVVHHGGAGTTYAALAAGRPALVIPHLGDQAYYGRRVHALGAGPAPIPRCRLRKSGLRSAVRRLADPAYAAGARAAQNALAREDGLSRAVEILEQL